MAYQLIENWCFLHVICEPSGFNKVLRFTQTLLSSPAGQSLLKQVLEECLFHSWRILIKERMFLGIFFSFALFLSQDLATKASLLASCSLPSCLGLPGAGITSAYDLPKVTWVTKT